MLTYSILAVQMACKLKKTIFPSSLANMPKMRHFIAENEQLVKKCQFVINMQGERPDLHACYDIESDCVAITSRDFYITDPTISECGRFEVNSSYYGLSASQYADMLEANCS